MTLEFSLNVFTELRKISDKNNIIVKKGIVVFEPAISHIRNQHSASAPGRYR